MNRRFTSFLMALLFLMGGATASAQLEELQGKAISLGVAVKEIEPGTWYFMQQNRLPNQNTSEFCQPGETPTTGGIMTDEGVGSSVLKQSIDNIGSPVSATINAKYLVRFVSTGEDDTYNIQFGTGNWLASPNNAQSSTLTTTKNATKAGEYNVYNILSDEPGYFGFNVAPYSWRIDNNGVGYTVVTWDTGKKTDPFDGPNSTWSVVSVEWTEFNVRNEAMQEMAAALEKYDGTYFMTSYKSGTPAPGNYDFDAVTAFNAAISAAYESEDNEEVQNMSDEEAAAYYRKCVQDIIDAYNAVIASRNTTPAVADGYYRIKSAATMSITEDGVSVNANAYLRSIADEDGTIHALWGVPDNLDNDLTSLWKVTNKDGHFDVQNMSTDARFNREFDYYTDTESSIWDSSWYINTIKMNKEADYLISLEPSVTLDDLTYYDIRVAPYDDDNYEYKGYCYYRPWTSTWGWHDSDNSWIYLWTRMGGFNSNGEYQLGETNWTLEYIDEETADAIINGYANLYSVLLAEAKANLAIANAYNGAQATVMGDVVTRLAEVINAREGLSKEDVTAEDYEALKAAYNAFMEKFIDPTTMRDAMKTYQYVGIIGTNPGFWSESAEVDAFKAKYAEVEAYNATGVYTAEEITANAAALAELAKPLYDIANKVRTDKWYRIRVATEEEFDRYGWNKSSAAATTWDEAMFGKSLLVSYWDDDYLITPDVSSEEMVLGDYLLFDSEDDITDKTLALFRFVAVGDSAYVLQNKGTNLFLKVTDDEDVVVDAHPSFFNVSAVGYGQNVIHAKDIWGNSQHNLYGWNYYNWLITGSETAAGGPTAFYIEEVEDIADDYEGDAFQLWAVSGEIAPYCFPVNITGVDSDYGQMYGVAIEEGEENIIRLYPIEEANAGRPFIYIQGDYDPSYYDANAYDYAIFKHGYTFVSEPDNNGALKGTFRKQNLPVGDVYASGNKFNVNASASRTVDADGAYISIEGGYTAGTALEIVIDWSMEDGIAGALASVAKSGAVYSIDGRLVSKKANVNDLQKFGKGIYILNGTKVVVK